MQTRAGANTGRDGPGLTVCLPGGVVMSKFGAGFGRDKDLMQQGRPGNSSTAAENQKYMSKRLETDIFTGQSFDDPRPTWWKAEELRKRRVPSPSRLGEWRLVWRPAPGGEQAAPKTSPEAPRPMDVWRRDPDAEQRRGHTSTSRGAEGRNQHNVVGSRPATRMTAASRLSRRAHSALGSVGEQLAGLDERERLGTGILNKDALHERQGTAVPRQSLQSRASRGSRASTSYTDLSDGSTVSSAAILARIRNLEDAIKSEKTLRVKMQSMLGLSQQGLGSRTPQGGSRLPALNE